MSKKLLLVYPHQRIQKLFKTNENIVFLDDRGWWVLDEDRSSRRLIEINDIEVNFIDNVDFKSILQKIDWWGPIWNRWIANADQYELLKREALFYVMKIIAGLNFFEISNSIFHTGVSHHLDTSLVEIACANNNIPQVFLYSNVFNGRLLPMIQVASIRDRKPLRRKISLYDSTKNINDLYKNQAPVSKRSIVFNSKTSNKHFRYAFYSLIRDEARSFLAKKVKYIIGYEGKGYKPILKEQQLKLSDHLRLVKQQKKALKFYLKNCLSHQEIKNTLENKTSIPLIPAHYQPEATSFPEGGDFNNHVDIVLKLRSLKVTSAIAYKEHPTSWTAYEPVVGSSRVGINRSITYYEQLLDLGCKFLPPDYSLTNQLQKKSWYLPISITGTICIERSLSGLPSIYTGYPIFKGLPGTYSMDEITNYNEFAKQIQEPGIFATEDVFEYLSDMLDFTTIVNILGVGNGQTSDDKHMVETFNTEYTQLVNSFL
jgi:hypothetical protein